MQFSHDLKHLDPARIPQPHSEDSDPENQHRLWQFKLEEIAYFYWVFLHHKVFLLLLLIAKNFTLDNSLNLIKDN